jgi:hypothetical protein
VSARLLLLALALLGCEAHSYPARPFDSVRGCLRAEQEVKGLQLYDSAEGGTRASCYERTSDGVAFVARGGLSHGSDFRPCSPTLAERTIAAPSCATP